MRTSAYLPGRGFLLCLLTACLFLVYSDLGFEGARHQGPDPGGWVRLVYRDPAGRFCRVRAGESLLDLLAREMPGWKGTLPDDCSGAVIHSGQEIRLDAGGGSLSCSFAPLAERYRYFLGMPMNMNRAGEEELELLPGIGKALARRIRQGGDERGGFSTMNELLSIRGIGAGLLKKVGRHATVDP